jgi:hypothetical protein
MTKRSRVDSLVVSLRKSKRQGKDSLPAAKRRALVREFGIDAVRALLIAEHPNWAAEVFEFGAHPECPWPYAGLDRAGSRGEVWVRSPSDYLGSRPCWRVQSSS